MIAMSDTQQYFVYQQKVTYQNHTIAKSDISDINKR